QFDSTRSTGKLPSCVQTARPLKNSIRAGILGPISGHCCGGSVEWCFAAIGFHLSSARKRPTYAYTYDTMGRPIKLSDNQPMPVDWVTGVRYGVANQLQQMSYGAASGFLDGNIQYSGNYTETRSYNSGLQITRLTVPGMMDME